MASLAMVNNASSVEKPFSLVKKRNRAICSLPSGVVSVNSIAITSSYASMMLSPWPMLIFTGTFATYVPAFAVACCLGACSFAFLRVIGLASVPFPNRVNHRLAAPLVEKVVNAYFVAAIFANYHMLFDFLAVVVDIFCIVFSESPTLCFCLEVGGKTHTFGCGAGSGKLFSCNLESLFEFVKQSHMSRLYHFACLLRNR